MKRLIGVIFCLLCGCAVLQRHPNSGYGANRRDNPSTGNLEENLVNSDYADNDIPDVAPTNDDSEHRLVRIGLEKKLVGIEEKRQYSQFKGLMTENERIEFLKLSDIYERDHW